MIEDVCLGGVGFNATRFPWLFHPSYPKERVRKWEWGENGDRQFYAMVPRKRVGTRGLNFLKGGGDGRDACFYTLRFLACRMEKNPCWIVDRYLGKLYLCSFGGERGFAMNRVTEGDFYLLCSYLEGKSGCGAIEGERRGRFFFWLLWPIVGIWDQCLGEISSAKRLF